MNLIALFMTKRGDETVRCARDLCFLREERTTLPFHRLSACALLMMVDLVSHQEGGVATHRTHLATIRNTPPPR